MKEEEKPECSTISCPYCGQGKLPMGKHSKCTLCQNEIDIVKYDIDKTEKRGPAWNMNIQEFEGIKP